MRAEDLPAVVGIGNAVHSNYPEAPDIFADKFNHFTKGCLTLADGAQILGYAISHPWRAGAPPKLDRPLGGLPARPDTLFLHDLCLAPEARGAGAGGGAVQRLVALGEALGVAALELVAVSGSAPFWARHGFSPIAATAGALDDYGMGAALMRRKLRGSV